VIFSLADTVCGLSNELLQEWRGLDRLLDDCDWSFIEE
jgi:hypothetical protein